MDKAIRFKCGAYRADAAIHHVAGGNDVHTGRSLYQCLLAQYLNGGVVHDVIVFSGVGVQQAILSVAGERVQRYIGHHTQFGAMLFQCTYHTRYQTIWVERFTTIWRFQAGINHGEQGHHRNTELDAFFGNR